MNPKNVKVKIPLKEGIVILIVVIIAVILSIKTISYYNEKDPSYNGFGGDSYEYQEESYTDSTYTSEESDVYYDDLDN